MRRNERKMGGFANWEIFGTGFETLIFHSFPAMYRFWNFGLFRSFLQFFRRPKNLQNKDFSAVSWDFEGRARPNFCSFSRDRRGLKFGSSRGVPQFWGDPKNPQNAVFPAVFSGFQRMGSPNFFGNSNFSAVFLGFWRIGPTQNISEAANFSVVFLGFLRDGHMRAHLQNWVTGPQTLATVRCEKHSQIALAHGHCTLLWPQCF